MSCIIAALAALLLAAIALAALLLSLNDCSEELIHVRAMTCMGRFRR